MRVWRAVDSGKIPDNWRAWVFRCAVNLKNDFLRRKYAESGVQSFETAVLPITAAPDEGETLAVKGALARLVGTDREVLTLKSMGFTSDEIGELLSISGSAVRTRLQKAKQNFQNALETEGRSMENKIEILQLRHPDYDRELTELVRSNLSPKAFREKLLDYHENDIAAALETLTPAERQRIYHALDAAELSAVLEYAEPMTPYLNELSLRRRVDVLSRMDADAAVDYLKTLESAEKTTLVELMDEPKRREIARLWVYGEDEIGSIMTTNCIVIPEGLSVKEAMSRLVAQAAEHDNISTIYVVGSDDAFYGAIDLKDLIIAREGDSLAERIATSFPYVYAHERIADALPRIQDYSEDSIPVLDEENRLLGVVTAQSLIQTLDDALSEDYARLAGLSAEEDLNETLAQSVRKRLPWLLVLLALGMIVSSVVGLFEGVVAQLTLIVCFQSLVLDMAGNVGTQSLAVTIRVLMDSETTGAQKRKLVRKEARIGLTNGAILGAASFVLIGAYLLLRAEAPLMAFGVSGCIGIALVAAMLLSSVSGTVIPIFFKKIGVDPAVASGPLITTVNDLVAVVSYYGLTWLLLIEWLRLT